MTLRPRIGIEIGPHRLRAVRLRGGRRGRVDCMEAEWSSAAPAETVAALRERFGTGSLLAVSVDIAALHVKRVPLPPLPLEERRRMLTIDPERYFPIRDEELVVAVRDDDLVFAARAEQFDRWTDALGTLGAVERVEPAPIALARHLARAGVTDGIVVMAHPGDRECAVTHLAQGRVRTARRIQNSAGEIAAAARAIDGALRAVYLYPWRDELAEALTGALGEARLERVVVPDGLTEPFTCAMGTALGIDDGPETVFVSASLARRQNARRRRRSIGAVTTLAAAGILLFTSYGASRSRVLRSLDERITERRAAAAEVQALQEKLAGLQRELGTLDRVESDRVDPLAVLLALTRTLPSDAYLRTVHNAGDQWELDGYARDAARLIPVLEDTSVFGDVRFRTATTRVRLGDENYENFSLALRYLPAP